MTITATVSSIAHATEDQSQVEIAWSHGDVQTYPADWRGFFRGGTGSRNSAGEEIQWIDGTEHDSEITVLDAFVANGGVVGPYVAAAEPAVEERADRLAALESALIANGVLTDAQVDAAEIAVRKR